MLALRLKAPDAARLDAEVQARGLVRSDYLRAVILDALDNAEPDAGKLPAGQRPRSLTL